MPHFNAASVEICPLTIKRLYNRSLNVMVIQQCTQKHTLEIYHVSIAVVIIHYLGITLTFHAREGLVHWCCLNIGLIKIHTGFNFIYASY